MRLSTGYCKECSQLVEIKAGKIYSVRLDPLIMEKIKEVYGGFTAFIDEKIKRDKKLKEAE